MKSDSSWLRIDDACKSGSATEGTEITFSFDQYTERDEFGVGGRTAIITVQAVLQDGTVVASKTVTFWQTTIMGSRESPQMLYAWVVHD